MPLLASFCESLGKAFETHGDLGLHSLRRLSVLSVRPVAEDVKDQPGIVLLSMRNQVKLMDTAIR
jgi:hypothetical protein